MHRFFIGEMGLRSMVSGDAIYLPEHLSHQLRDVLRLKVGEELLLFDNSGIEYDATILHTSKSGVEVELGESRDSSKEPAARIILCQGLMKSARFEWVLEKGTELGVTTFAPIVCQRSTSGLADAGPAKLQRWQRIIQEATEQCGGAKVPTLAPIQSLSDALIALTRDSLSFMPWEGEHVVGLHEILQNARIDSISSTSDPITIVIFIGPEGGLTQEEIFLARKYGVHIVSLGPRILRAETAALTAVANVVYELNAFLAHAHE